MLSDEVAVVERGWHQVEFCKRIGFSLLRVWLGYVWLINGIAKMQSGGWIGRGSGAEMTRFMQDVIARSTGDHPAVESWYASAAQSFGLPNANFLSYLLTYCEVFLGIVLLLGVFTTFSACVGCLLNLIYLLGNQAGLHPVMYAVAIALVVSGSAAGYYGIDRHIMPFLRRGARSLAHNLRGLMARVVRV